LIELFSECESQIDLCNKVGACRTTRSFLSIQDPVVIRHSKETEEAIFRVAAVSQFPGTPSLHP
jgi:hypothetical protein